MDKVRRWKRNCGKKSARKFEFRNSRGIICRFRNHVHHVCHLVKPKMYISLFPLVSPLFQKKSETLCFSFIFAHAFSMGLISMGTPTWIDVHEKSSTDPSEISPTQIPHGVLGLVVPALPLDRCYFRSKMALNMALNTCFRSLFWSPGCH